MERTDDFDVKLLVAVNKGDMYTTLFNNNTTLIITKNGVTIKLEDQEIADVLRTINNVRGY